MARRQVSTINKKEKRRKIFIANSVAEMKDFKLDRGGGRDRGGIGGGRKVKQIATEEIKIKI